MRTKNPILAAALAGSLLSASASAQTTLKQFNGDLNGNSINKFGHAVASLGDVDGDQMPDFLVGAPSWAVGGCGSGSHFQMGFASVVSGNGTTLRRHDGMNLGCDPWFSFGGGRTGISVAAIGDVDGDGMSDYLIGSDREAPNGADSGRARLYSGQTGLELAEFDGLAANDFFGNQVSACGDLDNDGTPDMLVAAPFEDQPLLAGCGSVRAISGATLLPLTTFYGTTVNAEMSACDRVGDVNGDGHDDILVGASGEDSLSFVKSGRVSIFSGAAPHGLLLVFEGTSNNEGMGYRVAGAGDLNLDGFPDILTTSEASPRVVHAFGAFGSTLLTIPEPVNSVSFGDSIAGTGDVDGDGRGDFLVGDPGFNGGEGIAYIYSRKPNGTARLITTLPGYGGEVGGRFGSSVSGVGHWDTASSAWVDGDFNGDGLDDALVGATDEYFTRGRVSVLSGVCIAPVTYCTSLPNTTGAPGLIGSQGSVSLGADDLVLTASQLPPGKVGIFYFGSIQIQTPFGCGLKCVGGTTHRMPPIVTIAPDGTATQAVDYSQHPELVPGSSWNFQLWYRDSFGCPAGTNFTDALSGTFCP